jgi:hypothetical protein
MDFEGRDPLVTWFQERLYENEVSYRRAQTEKDELVDKTRAGTMNPA